MYTIIFHTANYNGCHIQQNATDAVGWPTFKTNPQTTYSCVNSTANRNCNYDVHVLSATRGNGDSLSLRRVLSVGTINVAVSVNGNGNSRKSLVLVLLSRYPLNWILDIPSSIIIEKVLLVSMHGFSCHGMKLHLGYCIC